MENSEEKIKNNNSDQLLNDAINNQKSDIQVEGKGEVIKILEDDLDGDKHQKFIVKIPSGKTLLIAHNIDLAPRINNIKEGDEVKFYGEYEYNFKGGLIHWTHDDPENYHIGGWIKHKGIIYE